MSLAERIRLDRSIIENLSFNPYNYGISCGLFGLVRIEDREFVDLASNNYLGLAGNPAVLEGAKKGIDCFGVSLCGTSVATGANETYKDLERRLAHFIGTKQAALYPTGYQLNSGLFDCLARVDDCILIDRDAHASLVAGVRSAKCKIRPFRHNDLKSLEKNLSYSKSHPVRFVVVESVYSTEGSIAPLKEMYELCLKYDATLVVDDSHGIGVIGRSGRGALSHFGMDEFKGIYLASLGKAMASSGGVLGGSPEIVEYLKYSNPSTIYSTALTPPCVGALHAVLDVLENSNGSLHKRLFEIYKKLRRVLESRGFAMTKSEAPINSVIAGNSRETLALTQELFSHGILSTPFIFPSVPKNKGTVRLIAGAHISDKALDIVLRGFDRISP